MSVGEMVEVEVEVVGQLDWEVYQGSRVEVGFAEFIIGNRGNVSVSTDIVIELPKFS